MNGAESVEIDALLPGDVLAMNGFTIVSVSQCREPRFVFLTGTLKGRESKVQSSKTNKVWRIA